MSISYHTPGEIDKIPYDAPFSFPEPSPKWTDAKGGFANNRAKSLTEADVPRVDLTGKWIIVSGANNGIGLEAALTFASWGANLILACREPRASEGHPNKAVERCKALAKAAGHESQIEWWRYDATDFDSIEALARRWLETGRPLDILCNNAGVGSSPAGTGKVFKTKDGFEFIHQINLLSHVLMTLRLLPALAKAPAPRIICVTSCFHFLGKYDLTNCNGEKLDTGEEGVQFYKNSKLHFQIWLTELQHRLLQHDHLKHVTVNGVHPGFVRSGIWTPQKFGWISTFFGWIVVLVTMFFGVSNFQGSRALVYVATVPECGPDPKVQGGGRSRAGEMDDRGKGGGRYFNRIWEDEPMPYCRDRDARLRVWRKVDEEIKLRERGLLDTLGLYSGEP